MPVRRWLALALIVSVVIVGLVVAWIYLTPERLEVSTTTSLYATGLLEFLADRFAERYWGAHHRKLAIHFITVGTGRALQLVEAGDVDMCFVHAPNLEWEYIQRGVLVYHKFIAYNYFVIVGPPDDPAGIRGCDPLEAMRRIAEACAAGRCVWVSRGDNSGTHQRELLLWRLANLSWIPEQKPEWYIETGQGMSKTLLFVQELNAQGRCAYTLSDISTFTFLKKRGHLPDVEILVDRGDILINIYSAYIVNPEKYPHVKFDIAREFIDFITSDEGQELIAHYGEEEFGVPLFYPARGNEDWLNETWWWLLSISS